jgi:hypothetical protein
MKKTLLILLVVVCTSCKTHWYRQHKCKVAQEHIQYEHSRAAKDDPLRFYRNWTSRPQNNRFLFIFNLDK